MSISNQELKIDSRLLARLISNSGFKHLANNEGCKMLGKQLKSIVQKSNQKKIKNKCRLIDLLNFSFAHLQQDYRHEYIYKTKLLSDYVLNNYSLTDTILLNEFKIANSIADMVLINGTNKVFEIKTELDTPERLKTQLNDYYKAFSEVYIVTHYSLAARYELIVNQNVGIIIFNSDNKLTTYREAVADNSQLDNITMMKSLRKGEFFNIINLLTKSLPNTTQISLYRECLNIAALLDSHLLQKHFSHR